MDPETPPTPSEEVLDLETPLTPEEVLKPLPGVPSAKAQSWGVVISIVVIVGMVTVGAFYAWGQRVSQNQQLIQAATSNQ